MSFSSHIFYCHMSSKFKVFAGTKSYYFGEAICKSLREDFNLDIDLGKMKVDRFADGEFEVSYEESIRGCEVYLVQSTFPNSDNLMELLLMIDAAKRASAHSVIAVIPYFGWARQDRKDKPRVSIAAKLVADLITAAGADRVITMDLHADQIQGFFNIPLDHLYASTTFVPHLESLKLKNLVIATPDVGGAKRANKLAKYFKVPLILCHKQRAKANVIEKIVVIGDVEGKNVILLDDMVDTAGTITQAADLMIKHGAKSVRAVCTHAIMSDPATERIENSKLTEIIFTNSIPYERECSKVHVLNVAPMFARTILSVHSNESISDHYVIK